MLPSHLMEQLQQPSTTMNLGNKESDWARAIKLFIEEESTKKNIDFGTGLTDLDYAQLALVAKDDVYLAMKRLRRLRSYKEKYGIRDTIEDGMIHIRRLMQLMPDFLVSVGPETQRRSSTSSSTSSARPRNVIYIDENGFRPEALKKKADWATMWVALYYILQAVQSDVNSIRDGIVIVANCETIQPKKHLFSVQGGKKHFAFSQLYKDTYPINVNEVSFLQPCEMKKKFFKFCKPFLSKEMKSAVQLKTDTTDMTDRLSKHSLPTKMGGTQTQEHLLDFLEMSLIRRYENAEWFQLVKENEVVDISEVSLESVDFC